MALADDEEAIITGDRYGSGGLAEFSAIPGTDTLKKRLRDVTEGQTSMHSFTLRGSTPDNRFCGSGGTRVVHTWLPMGTRVRLGLSPRASFKQLLAHGPSSQKAARGLGRLHCTLIKHIRC